MTKQYNIQYNIGKVKYLVNYHDGIDTHNDGSPFFNIAIFSNKKELAKFILMLENKQYKQKQF